MKLITIVLAIATLVAFLLWRLDEKWRIGVVWRAVGMRLASNNPFPFEELRRTDLSIAACTDLGAYKRPLPNLQGVKYVVIMEDRSPRFFLTYDGYDPEKDTSLNRHGPLKEYRTHKDLRELVRSLHAQGVKVILGFWGFWGDGLDGPNEWLKKHPELKPRQRDESDWGNPFVELKMDDGAHLSVADYIAVQYTKLQTDFGFDGLMFGDGLSGFRAFYDPARYRDQGHMTDRWAAFYATVATTVHAHGGEFWAYDCMGFDYEEAKAHGADYRKFAKAGLDVLVFQTYPKAWVYNFRVPGKTGLEQDLHAFQSVREALRDTQTRLLFSLEMGDAREGWLPTRKDTRQQLDTFRDHADGMFLIWANTSFSKM